MFNLQKQLVENYELHGSFVFGAMAWSLDVNLIDKFAAAYKQLADLAYLLDHACHSTLREKCIGLMQMIFSELLRQCEDEYERLFLFELQVEAGRVLKDELDWYRRPPATHLPKLKNECVIDDTVGLFAALHYFGKLPRDAVGELQRLASDDVVELKANAAAGKLRRDDLSVNTGRTVHRLRDLLNREFSRLGVLDSLSTYAGRKIKVTGLALELSVPHATWWGNAIKGLDRPPKTLYAHVDESISFPKAIVYLTDVTEKNGPTGCYPGAYQAMCLNPLQEILGRAMANVGSKHESPLHDYYAKPYHQSMGSEKFRRHFMRLPQALRFNSHIGWDVAPESELESSMADNELKMTGPAGTFIVFDGARLLHRGGMVQQGERLALQVIFSDMTLVQRALGKARRMFS